jgi:transposase-like protein
VSKDIVSRTWRKVKTDWDAWCQRSLAEEDIVRLILDGIVGLEKALAALWPTVPTQRCTVHKHRNLLAHGRITNQGDSTVRKLLYGQPTRS